MKIAIVGGGLSGLLAGLVLARQEHAVTVVECDPGPPAADPEAVFERWARRGVAQARQPHLFLGRSVRVLRNVAPDVLHELLDAGALRLPVDLGDGPDDAVVCSRRLTYEATLRRVASRQRGVTIRSGAGVKDLVVDQGPVPHVWGVELDDGTVLTADLIVDASGRRSPTPRMLARHGVRPLPEVAQECGLLYLSRHYRLHPGADFPTTDVPINANPGWARAMAFPGDCRTFCLLVAVAAIDPLRRELATDRGFSRFHAAIPATAPWLHAGEPISDVTMMARVRNCYRRLVDHGPVVTGLVLLGDAAMHTNPTAGRGVSLAFAHVEHLAATIDRACSAGEFIVEFDKWTDANIGAWFQLQAAADASMSRRAEAAVRGESLPPPDRAEQIREVMIEFSKEPGPASLALRRMRNLVALPSEVLSDPSVLAAAADFLTRQGPRLERSAGPTRAAFAAGSPCLVRT
jgi:2-polyprenyl-6-methoxyphenol hydroxylase-like FAD-dependent oxidoreductase